MFCFGDVGLIAERALHLFQTMDNHSFVAVSGNESIAETCQRARGAKWALKWEGFAFQMIFVDYCSEGFLSYLL